MLVSSHFSWPFDRLTFVLASEDELFIMADKARARGEDVKRRRCCERQRAKAGGWRSLAHSRWSGGRGYLRRGKWRGCERFVSGSGGDRHIFWSRRSSKTWRMEFIGSKHFWISSKIHSTSPLFVLYSPHRVVRKIWQDRNSVNRPNTGSNFWKDLKFSYELPCTKQ